jgi:Fur family transcriptional regulator, ferric uptake regulator
MVGDGAGGGDPVKTAIPVTPFIRLFGRYLRDQGLPVTQQREAVAEVVFTSDEHLSVDDIERELRARGERIGKATIYRTLDLLVKSKLVEEHDFEEGFKRYEHRLSREPIHAHLVCTETGEILEFRSPEVQRILDEVAREHGFLPTHHKLVLFGLSRRALEAGATVQNEGLTCPIDTV